MNFSGKILKEETLKNLQNGKKKLEDYDIPGADMEALIKAFSVENSDVFSIHEIFVKKALNFEPGQNGILLNGRIIGPFRESENFGADDFNLLDKFSMSGFGEKLVNTLYSNFEVKGNAEISNLAMKLSSLLVSRPESKTRHSIGKLMILTLDGQLFQSYFDCEFLTVLCLFLWSIFGQFFVNFCVDFLSSLYRFLVKSVSIFVDFFCQFLFDFLSIFPSVFG